VSVGTALTVIVTPLWVLGFQGHVTELFEVASETQPGIFLPLAKKVTFDAVFVVATKLLTDRKVGVPLTVNETEPLSAQRRITTPPAPGVP